MKDYDKAGIMHWTDWDSIIRLCHQIEESDSKDKMHMIKGDHLIQLCQLVSNNGQGIYHFMDEIEVEQ